MMDFTAPAQTGPMPGIGAPMQPEPSPVDLVKQKMAQGKQLTADETNLVKGQPLQSLAALNQVSPEAPTQKLTPGAFPAASVAPINEIDPGVPQIIGMKGQIGQGGSMKDLGRKQGASLPGPLYSAGSGALGAVPPLPDSSTPIPQVPIQPVNKPGPAPIISSAMMKSVAPENQAAAQQALNAPITPEDTTKALDSVQKYLAQNPDRFSLANILDSVGVALSAYGGTQRKTKLQQDQEMQRQYALQQGMQQGEFKNQTALKGVDLSNAMALKGVDLSNAMALKKQDLANQTVLLQKELENAVAQNNVEYANQLKARLAEITAQMNANIQQERAVKGLGTSVPGLVNKYSGAPVGGGS
jgi:hypothetical protein